MTPILKKDLNKGQGPSFSIPGTLMQSQNQQPVSGNDFIGKIKRSQSGKKQNSSLASPVRRWKLGTDTKIISLFTDKVYSYKISGYL